MKKTLFLALLACSIPAIAMNEDDQGYGSDIDEETRRAIEASQHNGQGAGAEDYELNQAIEASRQAADEDAEFARVLEASKHSDTFERYRPLSPRPLPMQVEDLSPRSRKMPDTSYTNSFTPEAYNSPRRKTTHNPFPGSAPQSAKRTRYEAYPDDEDEAMRRAMEASHQMAIDAEFQRGNERDVLKASESDERRRLQAQQDKEYEEALAQDRAREEELKRHRELAEQERKNTAPAEKTPAQDELTQREQARLARLKMFEQKK